MLLNTIWYNCKGNDFVQVVLGICTRVGVVSILLPVTPALEAVPANCMALQIAGRWKVKQVPGHKIDRAVAMGVEKK